MAFAHRALGAFLPAIALAIVLVASNAQATPLFVGLGWAGEAWGVSPDGSVAVGSDFSGRPIRWTEETGPVALPGCAEPTDSSEGGSVLVGSCWSRGYTAVRWTPESGWGPLGGPEVQHESYADAVSSDGEVVAGTAYLPYFDPEVGRYRGVRTAFRWTESGGHELLGDLGGGHAYSGALGLSGDGSTVVGSSATGVTASGLTVGSLAFRWTRELGMQALGPGAARAASEDGSVVVGQNDHREAFRWTYESGMVVIGNGVAEAVSADGSVAAGWRFEGAAPEALVWTAENGMRVLRDVLIEEGLDLDGWELWVARDISDDGRTIVGAGWNPSGELEAWLARLPAITHAPEPSSFWLLFGAGGVVLRAARRAR